MTTSRRTADKALQGHISALRKVLPEGSIETTPQGLPADRPEGGGRHLPLRTPVPPGGASCWQRATPGRRGRAGPGPRAVAGRARCPTWPTDRRARPRRAGGPSGGPWPRRTCSRVACSWATTRGAARPDGGGRGRAAPRASVVAADAGPLPVGSPGRRPAGLPALPEVARRGVSDSSPPPRSSPSSRRECSTRPTCGGRRPSDPRGQPPDQADASATSVGRLRTQTSRAAGEPPGSPRIPAGRPVATGGRSARSSTTRRPAVTGGHHAGPGATRPAWSIPRREPVGRPWRLRDQSVWVVPPR